MSQKTQDIDLKYDQCWASVVDGGQALNLRWVNVLCMLYHLCRQWLPGKYWHRENRYNGKQTWARILHPAVFRSISSHCGNNTKSASVRMAFSYKLYIVGFGLVEMATSTNPKPMTYHNLYEKTDLTSLHAKRFICSTSIQDTCIFVD